MDISNEIIVICETLKMTETELAKELGVTYETINHWKNNRKKIDNSNLEKLYSYAYEKGIEFNRIYEQLIKEDNQADNHVILFHGAKKSFSMPIDFLTNSKSANDFGVGFYLGESFEQAANYISFLNTNLVYCFKLDVSNLKIYRFSVNTEWMLTIAYYRGWLSDYENSSYIVKLINKIADCDVIIAPIADNRMFDIITEFVEGSITDEQCRHALAATNLGLQYVIKTNKAVQSLSFIKELYVSKKEKGKCIENRMSITNSGLQKVKMARIDYKGKGKYIGEILK